MPDLCELTLPLPLLGHVQCVELLTSHGVNIDHNVNHLGTPLYVACENQQVDCARKLLESGKRKNKGWCIFLPCNVCLFSKDLEKLLLWDLEKFLSQWQFCAKEGSRVNRTFLTRK